jgi:murein DD-endopeptidase MepM/ murein hydrolase activator NlpD
MRFALAFILLTTSAAAIELALPVACDIGKTCWVQQYVDHDASRNATDFTCGVASYDGHDGTDIRVLHGGVTVDVLAAADGVVRGQRDGVADKLAKTQTDLAAVKDIECGNGVVIDHANGWQTQYCHMRQGSVAVGKGDKVNAGTILGVIGFSGAAEFPHVHVTVRKDGKTVDPFSADGIGNCTSADRSLWATDAAKQLAYEGTTVMDLRWSDHVLSDAEIEFGPLPDGAPAQNWPALVAYVTAINLHKDDELTLTVEIPGQAPVENRMVMPRNRAIHRLHAGKNKRADWPAGAYAARVEIRRNGKSIMTKEITTQLP